MTRRPAPGTLARMAAEKLRAAAEARVADEGRTPDPWAVLQRALAAGAEELASGLDRAAERVKERR